MSLAPLPMPLRLEALADDEAFDVVVLGAGGAGLSAAVFAAMDGARVLVVESTALVGGTTAWSAGTTWVPNTEVGAGVNPADTPQAAAQFLNHAVGTHAPQALREAFLAHGARAVRKMQAGSHLRYRARPVHPDYLSELPGSSTCGRALEPLPFDARSLGPLLALLRPPIPEFTVLGGMMVDRDDIFHLLRAHRSPASLLHSARIVLGHTLSRLQHGRGTRLLMGNALIGRLLLSLMERGAGLVMNTQATALHRGSSGAVESITLHQGSRRRRVRVRGGVVLAAGGFNRHTQWRAQRLDGQPQEWCAGAPGHQGGAQELAMQLGAQFGPTGQSDAFWAPVSLRQRPDGTQAVFPHFVFDRPKPHMLTVNAAGERFLNESTSYHLFGLAMRAAHGRSSCIPAWLITDAVGLQRYGLGMVRPRGMGLRSALADGYVLQGSSLPELAARMGVPATALQATVQRFNAMAAEGRDADFARGTTAYQRANGDALAGTLNPCLGPLSNAPFYALKLYPGDIGAATGLQTDTCARVLGAQGQPIAGLYAVGNDMHSVMGGVYPAPGITLGPGLVFACLAAEDALARARANPQ